MPPKKRPRGRPPKHPLPPRADATPEDLVRAFFRWRPGDPADFPTEYRCAKCERMVEFPDILYRDKRCADCTSYPVR